MSRPSSSRLSHRYDRPQSRIRRPKSAAPCLYPDEDEVMMLEERVWSPPPRPHTSFNYIPEELGEEEAVGFLDPELMDKDYSNDPDSQAWAYPEDSDPMKLVKKYGYGYRKPDTEVTPHWSQWPQPPAVQRPQRPAHPHLTTVHPQPVYVPKNHYTVQPTVYNPVINNTQNHVPATMTSRMRYSDERNVIMHRGLSPRRAAPPVMPGRSLTHYGGFGNRDMIGCLDLSAPSYSYRGFNASAPTGCRESRPMHRHLRTARQEEGYLHNNSIYYSTTPNVSGYFIIHPDWVSERLSMRRSQSLLAF